MRKGTAEKDREEGATHNIPNMINKRRYNNPPNIIPKLRLISQAPILAEQQILRQPLPILTEALVQRVVAHGFEEGLDLVEEVVFVRAVALVEELVPGLLEAVAFVGEGGGEDEAGLEEGLERTKNQRRQ